MEKKGKIFVFKKESKSYSFLKTTYTSIVEKRKMIEKIIKFTGFKQIIYSPSVFVGKIDGIVVHEVGNYEGFKPNKSITEAKGFSIDSKSHFGKMWIDKINEVGSVTKKEVADFFCITELPNSIKKDGDEIILSFDNEIELDVDDNCEVFGFHQIKKESNVCSILRNLSSFERTELLFRLELAEQFQLLANEIDTDSLLREFSLEQKEWKEVLEGSYHYTLNMQIKLKLLLNKKK